MRIKSESLAVASKVVHTAAANLTHVHGNFMGAVADRWLQLHDAKAVPANGVAPKMVWPLYNAGVGTPTPFDIVENLACAVGVVFVVSTTRATLTISTDTMDLFVHGDSVFDTTGVTEAGDYTTGTPAQIVWPTGEGPNRLLRLEFTALTAFGAVLYAKVFADDLAPVAGDQPLVQMPLRNNTSEDFFFDFTPQWWKALTLYQGCVVIIDATPGAYAADYSGEDYAIKGTYR